MARVLLTASARAWSRLGEGDAYSNEARIELKKAGRGTPYRLLRIAVNNLKRF